MAIQDPREAGEPTTGDAGHLLASGGAAAADAGHLPASGGGNAGPDDSPACPGTPGRSVPPLTLHGYYRSSAAYRVRIALALKGLAFEQAPVHLVRGGGEQHRPAFRAINPLGLVPVLQAGDFSLSQSLAIIEYLEELHPAVPLLPASAELRARARQLALMIACEIHPLNNPRVFAFLGSEALASKVALDEALKLDWMRHWIGVGFAAVEAELARVASWAPATSVASATSSSSASSATSATSAISATSTTVATSSTFCVGETPTVADCCLVPQVYNARRFGVDLAPYPSIVRIDAACAALPAFAAAHPSRQPDAE